MIEFNVKIGRYFYRPIDIRTAEDYLCELIQRGLVDTHYGIKAVSETIDKAIKIINKEGQD